MEINCPSCNEAVLIADEDMAQTLDCPFCQQEFKIDSCPGCGGELRKWEGLIQCWGCGYKPNLEGESLAKLLKPVGRFDAFLRLPSRWSWREVLAIVAFVVVYLKVGSYLVKTKIIGDKYAAKLLDPEHIFYDPVRYYLAFVFLLSAPLIFATLFYLAKKYNWKGGDYIGD